MRDSTFQLFLAETVPGVTTSYPTVRTYRVPLSVPSGQFLVSDTIEKPTDPITVVGEVTLSLETVHRNQSGRLHEYDSFLTHLFGYKMVRRVQGSSEGYGQLIRSPIPVPTGLGW